MMAGETPADTDRRRRAARSRHVTPLSAARHRAATRWRRRGSAILRRSRATGRHGGGADVGSFAHDRFIQSFSSGSVFASSSAFTPAPGVDLILSMVLYEGG